MTPASRFAPRKRTQADRDRDLTTFCIVARDEAVAAVTADELASRYGCALKLAEYRLTIAKQKRGLV